MPQLPIGPSSILQKCRQRLYFGAEGIAPCAHRRAIFKKRCFALAVVLCVISPTGAHDVTAPLGIDLTRLPLGDKEFLTSPRPDGSGLAGWRVPRGAAAAPISSPWITGDTYDLTAKAMVSGSVTWPFRFAIAVAGDKRVFTSNDLPNHPTGVFPISPDDAAYKTDRNPNHIAAQDMRVDLPLMPVLALSRRVRRGPSFC